MVSLNSTLQQFFFTPEEDFLNTSVFINWAGHRFCEPNHHIGPRVLEGYKLVFIIRGQGTLIQGTDEPVSLKQGDMFFLFPRERHEYWADPNDPWELMWVHMNGIQLPGYYDVFMEKNEGIPVFKSIHLNKYSEHIKKNLTTR